MNPVRFRVWSRPVGFHGDRFWHWEVRWSGGSLDSGLEGSWEDAVTRAGEAVRYWQSCKPVEDE